MILITALRLSEIITALRAWSYRMIAAIDILALMPAILMLMAIALGGQG